jgi:prepilin-type processing-associated H-X9-DG protein
MDAINHLANTTFLFADGHVKSLKPSATIRGMNMWSLEPATDTVPSQLTAGVALAEANMR